MAAYTKLPKTKLNLKHPWITKEIKYFVGERDKVSKKCHNLQMKSLNKTISYNHYLEIN